MKKIVLLLMATFALAFYTKAQDTKNQYVKWSTVPDAKKVQIVWLKNAMQGKSIPGAAVRSNAESYKAVWGEDLYNKVLNADNGRFSVDVSNGGETNWAVASDGSPVTSGTLSPGVVVVILDGQPIAKWGTNGCLNALSPAQSYVDDGEDPDNQKQVLTRTTPKTSPNGPSNNNNNNVVYVPVGNQEIPWNAGYGIYSQGRNDRTAAFSEDALMFMAIQKSATSNCGGCATATTTTTVAPAPSMYYISSAPQPAAQAANYSSGDIDVNVRNKPNALDYINTAANVASTFFTGVNTYRGVRLEGNRNQTVRYNNNSGNSTVRDFQGSGAQNYTSSGGGLIYSGGTTGGYNNGW